MWQWYTLRPGWRAKSTSTVIDPPAGRVDDVTPRRIWDTRATLLNDLHRPDVQMERAIHRRGLADRPLLHRARGHALIDALTVEAPVVEAESHAGTLASHTQGRGDLPPVDRTPLAQIPVRRPFRNDPVVDGDVVALHHHRRKAGWTGQFYVVLWWAAGYNLIAVPLAAGALAPIGFVLHMSIGALLMSASTVVVALNAQLLRRLDLTPAASTTKILGRHPCE